MDTSSRSLLVYYTVWSFNSIIGFIALLVWFNRLPCTGAKLIWSGRSNYWVLTVLTAILVVGIRLIINSNPNIIDLADTCISASFIGLILSSLIDGGQVYSSKELPGAFSSNCCTENRKKLRHKNMGFETGFFPVQNIMKKCVYNYCK